MWISSKIEVESGKRTTESSSILSMYNSSSPQDYAAHECVCTQTNTSLKEISGKSLQGVGKELVHLSNPRRNAQINSSISNLNNKTS